MIDVCFHDGELLVGQFSRFQQNPVTDSDLADVMEEGSLDQAPYRRTGDTEQFAQPDGIERHPIVMDIGVAVAFGNGASQHLQHAHVSQGQIVRIFDKRT